VTDADFFDFLKEFISKRRYNRFQEVLQYRTRYLTVLLEDIYQSHNASAVLRSCDCLGIQDVHIVENRNTFTLSPDVALGSSKWVTLFHYNKAEANNTEEAFRYLKSKGYRIIATSPHHKSVSLGEFDLAKGKSALLFGTELTGLSDYALENADEYLYIPMFGFTESFNISVTVAIVLYDLVTRLHTSDLSWKLCPEEMNELALNWTRNSLKRPDMYEKRFREKGQ